MIGSLALKDNGESAMKGRTDTIGSLNLSNSNLNCLAQSQEVKTSKDGCTAPLTTLSGIGGLFIGGIMGIFFSFACVFTGFCKGIAKKCCHKNLNYQRHTSTAEMTSVNHNAL